MTDPGPASSKFSLRLDAETDARFDTLVRLLGTRVGALPSHRGRRYPSRADLLRAALLVIEQNPEVLEAVETEVLREALLPVAATELRDVAAELARYGPRLATPDAQDTATTVVADLNRLASNDPTASDRAGVSAELAAQGVRIERLAATAGGYEGLRPMLDLARRLRMLRDALDPGNPGGRATCPRCYQVVRRSETNTDGLERHCDQAGSICQDVPARL